MILGKIIGKTTTSEFKFRADKEIKKFEYVQVYNKNYDYVLCQILEIEKDSDKTIAFCQVIGYNDNGKIKKPRIPLDAGSEVLLAEDEFIKEIISITDKDVGGLLGKLDGKNIQVHMDLNKILTMHLAVLAKSGSGKSYAVGVLLEEIMKKKIPIIVIDPHGEYGSLKLENEEKEEIKKLALYNLKPQKFEVSEFGDVNINPESVPLRITNKLTQDELLHLMPGKLSNAQLGILYNALKNDPDWSFESLLLSLDQEENNAKWSVINLVDHLRHQKIFSDSPISYNELLKGGKCSIINMKGINPETQEIVVYKLCKDLFELRKKNKIPPFFLVVEEAHNYCPERSFGETKSSKILRTIASEGRKFGMGLCIISQRPARVDKSVLSQCSSQIILKVTNPNDLKAVSQSIEGLTASAEKEIQNLPIGTSIVTGITDSPLIVNIRPRQSSHGGKAKQIIEDASKNESFMSNVKDYEEQELLPINLPNTSKKDMLLMSDSGKDVKTVLIPCYLFLCKDGSEEYKLLVNLETSNIIVDKESSKTRKLPDLKGLTSKQMIILKYAFKKKSFKESEVIRDLNTDFDVKEDIDMLENKGFLIIENENISLSKEYIFTKLSRVQIYDVPKHKHISYDSMISETYSLDEILAKLSGFTSVIDKDKCYLVKYELV